VGQGLSVEKLIYEVTMNYDVSDLQEIWRKGDGEMPKELQRVVNAAREESLLRSLQLSE